MNNILSESFIDKISTGSTSAIKTIFKDAISDANFQKRRAERMGVYNRLKLEPVSSYKYFGRAADGVPVYKRPDSKNNNDTNVRLNLKCHKDYPNIITSNKSGYLSGFKVISSIDNDKTVDIINDFLHDNDFDSTFNDLVQKTCAYGLKSIQLMTNRNTGDLQLTTVEPWSYAPFYDQAGTLVAVLQWQEITDTIEDIYQGYEYMIRLTTSIDDLFFLSSGDYAITYNNIDYPALVTANGLELPEGRRPHQYRGVPIVEFKNNGDSLGDVEKTLDSQDIVDEIKSKASTEMSAFASVTLVNKDDTEQDLNVGDMFKVMGDYGVLTGKWEWLEKQFSAYPQIYAHYMQLEHDIYESSNSYDPNAMGGDGAAPTAFQIKQKMKGLMNATIDTESQFRGALLELFRLILTYTNREDQSWRNLDIVFEHTIPEDRLQSIKLAKEAGYIAPQEIISKALGLDHDKVIEMIDEDRQTINNALMVE